MVGHPIIATALLDRLLHHLEFLTYKVAATDLERSK
ncbi:hypothetical protein [Bacillus sp. CECT 9360]